METIRQNFFNYYKNAPRFHGLESRCVLYSLILNYVRDHNILKKAELIRLQSQFEDCMTQIQAMQRQANSIPLAASLTAGILGTAFIAGSVFAVAAQHPVIWLTIVLAIPGFLLWGTAYPICRFERRRQREKLLPLIEKNMKKQRKRRKKQKSYYKQRRR